MKFDRKLALDTFIRLCRIPSPSLAEEETAAALYQSFSELGCKCEFDSANRRTSGRTGNLIVSVPGKPSSESVSGLVLCAHMDTVTPCVGIQPVKSGTDKIVAASDTILGADCRAGLAICYGVAYSLLNSSESFPSFEILFTTAEEIGLQGALHLDSSLIRGRVAIVLDSDIPGMIHYASPGVNRFRLTFHGKSAHSGTGIAVGINAIVMAAHLIHAFPWGDKIGGITSNAARIEGGGAINVVPDCVSLDIELRSLDPSRLEETRAQLEAMALSVCEAATTRAGRASFEISELRTYPPVTECSRNSWFDALETCLRDSGLKVKKQAYGGGFDGNELVRHGFQVVNVPNGSREIHSTQEFLDLKSFYRVGDALCSLLTRN